MTATCKKVVFVTGAGSGIGRAAAERIRSAWLCDGARRRRRGSRCRGRGRAEPVGATCTFVHCDVTDDATVADAVAQTVVTIRSPRLRRSMPRASTASTARPTAECTMENWNRVIAVDLTGTWSCMRYEIPAIIEAGGGAIVNCASVAGLRAAPTVPAYTAAKHGVVGLTRVAAREYAPSGRADQRDLPRHRRHTDVPSVDVARGHRQPALGGAHRPSGGGE